MGDNPSTRCRVLVTLVVRRWNELRQRVDELSENFNKRGDRKYKSQTEKQSITTEMRHTLEETRSRVDEAEDQISDSEDSSRKRLIRKEKKSKKMGLVKDPLGQLRVHHIRRIVGVPEERESEGFKPA